MSRKIRREMRRRAKKEAERRVAEVTKQVARMGKTCSGCGSDFDRSSDTHLDTWRVEVYDDRVVLLCPKCQSEAVQ